MKHALKKMLISFLLLVLFSVTQCFCFANLEVGQVVPNPSLQAIDSSSQDLLKKETVNVFIFFRPDQDGSKQIMAEVSKLQVELGERPVRIVGIVSNRYPKETIQSFLTEVNWAGPVLLDKDDLFYAQVGVIMEPSAGITNKEFKLVGYQYFTKINFALYLNARIRHTLGEIGDAELEATLHPTMPPPEDEKLKKAKVYYNFALTLYKSKKYEKALTEAKKSIEYCETFASAHALLGDIYYALDNNCDRALPEYKRAVELNVNVPLGHNCFP